jgi:AcrR family transcriptional regulator
MSFSPGSCPPDLSDTPATTARSPKAQAARERLLDTAERLFAEHGFNGVSVRDITQQSGSRLADVNDHFGNKEGLFKDVIARRACLINVDRFARLDAISPGVATPEAVRAWVAAFSEPLLARALESEGWRHYLRLIARLSTTRSGVLMLVADQFNPVALRFVAHLGPLLPNMDARQLLNAYQFMVACAMAVFVDNFRLDTLSGSAVRSSDFEANHANMVHFVTHGVLGMAA